MTWQPRVGAATGEVEVPPGTPMAGYAARASGTTGVHDPMTVRALVVDRVAVVVIDCCTLHEDTCARVREAALAAGAVDEVVVAATHTHAGPCVGGGRVGEDAPEVREAMVATAVATVARAAAGATPATAAHAVAHGVDLARNRRHLDASIDPPVHLVSFDDLTGARVATVVSYPCHPVVLDASNTLVSADYVGPLRQRVEADRGGVCLFLTGAAGDINTGHSAEASYSLHGAGQRTFAEAARVGHRIAEAALAAEPTLLSAPAPTPVRSSRVVLDLDELDRARVAQQARGWRAELADDPPHATLLQVWAEWADSLPDDCPTSWAGRVTVLGWGSLRVVALPGEPFLAAAEDLAAQREAPTMVLGYCDGVPGYLPSAPEYPLGGYEVADAHRYYGMPAGFVRGSLERLVEAATALLDE
ncbi:neutral/alkaline non-lysosomal ceramidase N-terminal domain-containing protein [Aestuariimicrobium sp. Y1814]|uniref:neutral/alkaline non-lysosomal ceramidase N-terminal domain-containing protein n=1 Tax=Aestuariimicrobium sp. Y1814 TaxID=3418742 RepID=UPI003DA741CC